MNPTSPSFAELLRSAVTESGIISAAYRQFHHYSFWQSATGVRSVPGARDPARPVGDLPTVAGTRPACPERREGDHALHAGDRQADRRGRERRRGFGRVHTVHLPAELVRPGADRRRRLGAGPDPGIFSGRSPSLSGSGSGSGFWRAYSGPGRNDGGSVVRRSESQWNA
jgi:hypothetical protein